MLIIVFVYRFYSFSRAVFIIYWGLMVILVSLSRLSFRLLDEEVSKGNRKGKQTLIYGVGAGGQVVMKEIEKNPELGMGLVGFIDDNPRIHGRKINGYPIFGGQDDLAAIIPKYHIQKIIVSFKKNGIEKKKEIQNLCVTLGTDIEVAQMKLIIY
jgi:UDP-GlcNAc:undecaprenyl-phosphate GlcNAc-1-phosphate transferase